jgi:zinc protease
LTFAFCLLTCGEAALCILAFMKTRVLVSSGLLALPLLALAQPPQTAPAAPQIVFQKHTLPNGLQLILHVDRKLPVVHVNLWFHVGSKNERIGRSGFAHLFEHMMFEGSKNASQKYFTYAEKAGASQVDATTDWDFTNYFITVPSANLEHVLWLESDRVATLADAVSKERFDSQRDVVRNELRQEENQPYGRWLRLICENLYPHRHPYANDISGSHEDLLAATVDDVKDFFRTYYTPNNLSLAIAGDFDLAETKRLVGKYFGGIPAGPALDRPPRWIPVLDGERIIEVRDRVPQERTYFAWHSPACFDPGNAELGLASTILTDGLSSRLNKVLVYDQRLCSDVASIPMGREHASIFIIWATARPGASLAEIEAIVTGEIARLARDGPTLAELSRAKAKWEFAFISELERIGGKADMLNRYNTFLGDPNRFEADLARYRDPTVTEVRDMVARWLNTRNRLLVRFRPETSGREMQVALDRAQAPPLGTDRPFQAPQVRAGRLDNGLEVLLIERHDLPKVAVQLVTKAGAAADPPAKAGLAALTVETMRRGTQSRKALEIEEAMGELGSSIWAGISREFSNTGFGVLKRNLSPALAIFADVVRKPVFPGSEVDLEKKRRLDALSQESQSPDGIAGRVAWMLAFGRNHPYGTPVQGLPGTVEKLTREDFVQFYERHWKPGSSALIFAGDIAFEEAMALAKEAFGAWSGGARTPSSIPKPQPVGPGKVFLIDRQDAPQTMIVQLVGAPPRKSEEYFALRLADAIWGGAASARLSLNLREEKGYTYGVSSFPAFYSTASAWGAGGSVQTDKTKESVIEFLKELNFLAGEKPVTAEELALAKANRIRGYAQQFETLDRLAGQVAELWALGLPMSELQREPVELDRTPLAAVNAVARKYAVQKESTLLLVGDLAKITAPVREVVKGEIVVLDVEGNPVRR